MASPLPATTPAARLTRGYLIALTGTVIWSTTAIFIRYLTLTYSLPPLVLAFWRDLFVALTLIPALALIRPGLLRVPRKQLAYLALYGLVLAGFNSLWTVSVKLNGAAVSTVMAYSSAGFTALLGWWWLHEDLGWGKIVAVVLSLTGCALISGAVDPAAWRLNAAGILVGVFSGLGFAFYTMMGRSASRRGLNPWSTLLYSFAFAAMFLLLFNLLPLPVVAAGGGHGLQNIFWLGSAAAGWLVLYILAAGPSIGGYGLYNVSLGYLPSSVANLIATLEPAFTAVIAFFLLGESLSGLQLVGGAMILGGVVFLRVYESRKNP